MKVFLLGDSVPEQSVQSAILNSETERARIKYDEGDSYSHALVFLGETSHPITLLSLSPPSLAGHKREGTSLVSGPQGGSECGLAIPGSPRSVYF